MSESIHDIAMKLGLLNDTGSFKQGEKLMKDFADAAIQNNKRIQASISDLSKTDKYLNAPDRNILKSSDIERLQTENISLIENKFQQGLITREQYNIALGETTKRWAEITQAQQANIAVLQHQQAVQTLSAERTEDEIIRQRELLELKQDIINRNRTRSEGEKEIASLVQQYNKLQYETLSIEDKLAILERERRQELILKANTARAVSASMEDYRKAVAAINAKYEQRANILRNTTLIEKTDLDLKKRAISLLNNYSEITDRIKEDILSLDAALAKNIITQEQHARATAIANQRLDSIRTSSGNAVYAVGELGRGLEDFVTVMSITGFTTQGFGMAMRGASNNISQAATLMAGSTGAWLGTTVGISAVLVGQLVPYLWKTQKAVDEVTMAYEKNRRTLENLRETTIQALDSQSKLTDISRIQSSSEAKNLWFNNAPKEIEKLQKELNILANEKGILDQKNINSVLGTDMNEKITTAVTKLREHSQNEAANAIEQTMMRLRAAIADGNAQLIEQIALDLKAIKINYKTIFDAVGPDGLKTSSNFLKDTLENATEHAAKKLQDFLTDKEKVNKLQEEITEQTNKELKDKEKLKALEEQLVAAKERYTFLLEKEEDIRDKRAEKEAKIIEQRADIGLFGQLNRDNFGNKTVDAYLMDFSVKYRDLMSISWITQNSQNSLENAFDSDLIARKEELERELFKKQPDTEVGTSTITEAFTNAQKQMMDAANDQTIIQQLNELKAIREALNRNLFPVERIN